MREFVGVAPQVTVHNSSFKREALIFSRIVVWGLSGTIQRLKRQSDDFSDSRLSDLEWLIDQGIILGPNDLPDDSSGADDGEADHIKYLTIDFFEKLISSVRENKEEIRNISEVIEKIKKAGNMPQVDEIKAALAPIDNKVIPSLKHVVRKSPNLHYYLVRDFSSMIRAHSSIDAYPILTNILPLPHTTLTSREDVVQIVLKALPLPDDTVPWEQILDYRSDPDSKSKFLALRNWMLEMANSKISSDDIEIKLEYLIDQYQKHLKLHRIKTNATVFETIVVAGAEIIENLAKLNLGKIAKSLFSFRHRNLALLERELTVPGKEIAYLVKARDHFSVAPYYKR